MFSPIVWCFHVLTLFPNRLSCLSKQIFQEKHETEPCTLGVLHKKKQNSVNNTRSESINKYVMGALAKPELWKCGLWKVCISANTEIWCQISKASLSRNIISFLPWSNTHSFDSQILKIRAYSFPSP